MQTSSSSTSESTPAGEQSSTTPAMTLSTQPAADHRPRATTHRRVRPQRRTDRFGVFSPVAAPAPTPDAPVPGQVPLADERRLAHSFAAGPIDSRPASAPPAGGVPQGDPVGEYLGPLLPPIIEPGPSSRWTKTPDVAPARRTTPASIAPAQLVTERRPPRRSIATGRRSRLRLTLRGRFVIVALIVGAIAGTSAVAGADRSPAVPAAEVQVLPGDTVHSIAAQVAQGREVAEVAAAISAANGLPGSGDAPLEPGSIRVVPGSAD